ncbi:MAG: FkbM family methyltransferase, partial [Candidatus Paceibacterota bacterium]
MENKTRIFNWIRKILKFYPIEVCLRKLTIGKRSSSFIGRLVPNNYQYDSNSIREFNYYGVNLSVNISDYVGHYLYFGFKDYSNESLISLVSPGSRIIDIGTNIGATALQLALHAGNEGFVYGFEPDTVNYLKCIENIKLNNIRNIFVENIGLGKQEATLNMIVETPLNRGGNRIKNRIDDEDVEQKLVKITTLDKWVKNKDNLS